jgi:hypothetical protein
MAKATQIREDMEVLGADGQHVGTVDKVVGNIIKLTRNDPAALGRHHFLPMDNVASVDHGKVRLNQPASTIHQQWQQATQGLKGRQGRAARRSSGGIL